MERIIKLDESLYNRVKEKIVALSDIPVLCKAVDDSIPYNPSGDCISREYIESIVRAEFVDLQDGTDEWRTRVNDVCESILTKVRDAQAIKHSLLPLSGEADNAYMRGHEVGKAEGIMKASTRPKGVWINQMETKGYVVCPFCGKEITGGDLNFCVKCGADMREE